MQQVNPNQATPNQVTLKRNLKRNLLFTGGIVNIFEWYDYALFGHFAALIGQKFFPDSDPDISLLHAFLIFAIGYLIRPIGGIFFGIIGDKFGRKVALSASVMGMALPMAAMGFLPTYDTLGVTATRAMILVRMLQGLSMGGALTGSISFIIEHAEQKHRGFAGSIAMSGICIGILLGSLVIYLTKTIFSCSEFEAWAWRIPFIIGIFIFLAGIYIKKNSPETPLFNKTRLKGKISHSPLKEVIKSYWMQLIISIFINATGSVIFYLEAIYLVNYLKTIRNLPELEVNRLVNSGYLVMAMVTLFAGWLSDRISRKKIFYINLLLVILLSPVLLNIIENGQLSSVIIAYLVIAIIAALYIGPEPAIQAELFPTHIRNTALSLSYNMGTSIFGGTTPYIIQLILQRTDTITTAIYYIIPCAVLSLIALYFYQISKEV